MALSCGCMAGDTAACALPFLQLQQQSQPAGNGAHQSRLPVHIMPPGPARDHHNRKLSVARLPAQPSFDVAQGAGVQGICVAGTPATQAQGLGAIAPVRNADCTSSATAQEEWAAVEPLLTASPHAGSTQAAVRGPKRPQLTTAANDGADASGNDAGCAVSAGTAETECSADSGPLPAALRMPQQSNTCRGGHQPAQQREHELRRKRGGSLRSAASITRAGRTHGSLGSLRPLVLLLLAAAASWLPPLLFLVLAPQPAAALDAPPYFCTPLAPQASAVGTTTCSLCDYGNTCTVSRTKRASGFYACTLCTQLQCHQLVSSSRDSHSAFVFCKVVLRLSCCALGALRNTRSLSPAFMTPLLIRRLAVAAGVIPGRHVLLGRPAVHTAGRQRPGGSASAQDGRGADLQRPAGEDVRPVQVLHIVT